MKRIDPGQIITILANLGVIAGIVFLAIEMRQNNELLAAQSRAVRIDIRTGFSEALYANHELAIAMVKAHAGEELTPVETYLIDWFTNETLDKFEYVFGEYQRGMIAKADLAVEAWRVTFHEDIPGMLEHWEREKGKHSQPFVDYIEEQVLNR